MKAIESVARVPIEYSFAAVLHLIGEWGEDWVTASLVSDALGVSKQAAWGYLREMEAESWIERYPFQALRKRGGVMYYWRFTIAGGYHYEQNKAWCVRAFDRICLARGSKND